MSARTGQTQTAPQRARWRHIGPGIVAAATGVGAGDLVASLVAGSKFGYALFWAVIVGVIVKMAMGEAVGRWHLASDSTIFAGWRSLGRWTAVYFAPYIVIWGFVYGAAAMSATGLALNALVPALDVSYWGIICGVVGLALVLLGGYLRFERLMTILVGVMFVTVVSVAIMLAPDVPQLLTGIVPSLPQGSALYALGLLGGVGGTITMAAYGSWIGAKGWRGRGWVSTMRLDNTTGYVITGIFVIAMLVVGAELLHAIGKDVTESDEGLITLAGLLSDQFGGAVRILFLIGFFAAGMTSLLGSWNGVSLLFSNFVRDLRGKPYLTGEAATTTPEFRVYAAWLTFPPIALLFLGKPFYIVVVYGALGALFLPFLGITLLLLLNSGRVERGDRSGWLSNIVLTFATVVFVLVFAQEIYGFF